MGTFLTDVGETRSARRAIIVISVKRIPKGRVDVGSKVILSDCGLFPNPPGVAVWRLAGDPPLLPRGTRLPQEGAVRSAQLPAEHGASRRGVDGRLQGALLQPQPAGQKGRAPPGGARARVLMRVAAAARNVWSRRLRNCKSLRSGGQLVMKCRGRLQLVLHTVGLTCHNR